MTIGTMMSEFRRSQILMDEIAKHLERIIMYVGIQDGIRKYRDDIVRETELLESSINQFRDFLNNTPKANTDGAKKYLEIMEHALKDIKSSLAKAG